jgi:hypothetical protein
LAQGALDGISSLQQAAIVLRSYATLPPETNPMVPTLFSTRTACRCVRIATRKAGNDQTSVALRPVAGAQRGSHMKQSS